MFLLVETTLKVWLHRLRLSDPFTLDEKMYSLRLLFCQDLISIIYQLWRTISSQFLGRIYKVLWRLQNWTSISFLYFFLVGVQAPDKECGGSFFGGLFPGGERYLGRWHHRRGRQAADGRRWEGDKPARPCWIPVTRHQSEVSLTNKSSHTDFAASSAC